MGISEHIALLLNQQNMDGIQLYNNRQQLHISFYQDDHINHELLNIQAHKYEYHYEQSKDKDNQ